MATKSQTARLMLDWEQKNLELLALEAEISENVLEFGETFDVGDIRASFANPRKSYHWEESGKAAAQDVIDKHTENMPEEIIPAFVTTHWKAVCEDAGIAPSFDVTSVAKVTVKMK